jgi:hypothetical protein
MYYRLRAQQRDKQLTEVRRDCRSRVGGGGHACRPRLSSPLCHARRTPFSLVSAPTPAHPSCHPSCSSLLNPAPLSPPPPRSARWTSRCCARSAPRRRASGRCTTRSARRRPTLRTRRGARTSLSASRCSRQGAWGGGGLGGVRLGSTRQGGTARPGPCKHVAVRQDSPRRVPMSLHPAPQTKMAKVEVIMAQRAALVEEVKRVQAAMAQQEVRMRQALEHMQVRPQGGGGGGWGRYGGPWGAGLEGGDRTRGARAGSCTASCWLPRWARRAARVVGPPNSAPLRPTPRPSRRPRPSAHRCVEPARGPAGRDRAAADGAGGPGEGRLTSTAPALPACCDSGGSAASWPDRARAAGSTHPCKPLPPPRPASGGPGCRPQPHAQRRRVAVAAGQQRAGPGRRHGAVAGKGGPPRGGRLGAQRCGVAWVSVPLGLSWPRAKRGRGRPSDTAGPQRARVPLNLHCLCARQKPGAPLTPPPTPSPHPPSAPPHRRRCSAPPAAPAPRRRRHCA